MNYFYCKKCSLAWETPEQWNHCPICTAELLPVEKKEEQRYWQMFRERDEKELEKK